MDNDFTGKFPELDFSRTFDLASTVQSQFEANQRKQLQETQRLAEEAYNNRQRIQRAVEETAANTGAVNEQLNTIIKQQSSHITLLEKQVELQERQLDSLNEIFASTEDGVLVEKEIMKLIADQIDSSHPLWDYVKDKGGDIAVAGAIQIAPIIWSAIKAYLVTKGILLP